MAIADFPQDIEAAIVAVFAANSDLDAFCGTIEVGEIDEITIQDITVNDMPYVGVITTAFGPDRSRQAGISVFDVQVKCSVAAVDAVQKTAKEQVMKMLAQLHLLVARQRHTNNFTVNDSNGSIADVTPGSGVVMEPLFNPTAGEEGMFLLFGTYLFTVEYRLNIV